MKHYDSFAEMLHELNEETRCERWWQGILDQHTKLLESNSYLKRLVAILGPIAGPIARLNDLGDSLENDMEQSPPPDDFGKWVM